MHIVHKPDGKLRICLDLRSLNKPILRGHFKLPTREEVMPRMVGEKMFSKRDCSKGFWQLQLDEKTSRLCTFITLGGRHRYQRLPFGISSATEIYYIIIRSMFEGIKNVETSMENIMIWGTDTKSQLQTVKIFVNTITQLSAEKNVKLTQRN